MNAESSVEFLA